MTIPLTQTVLRHRLLVLGIWALVSAAGVAAAVVLPGHLTALTSVPGAPAAQADTVLVERFSENADGSFTIVVPFGQASDAAIDRMRTRLARAVDTVPTARVVQQRAVGGTLYALVSTRLSLLDAARATDGLRAALHRERLPRALVTGPPALERDVQPVLAADLWRGTAIALGAGLLLLLLVLGWSPAVAVPFIVGAAAVAASEVAVLALALRTPMVLYIPNVIELIGFGLAVDYGLLVIHRLRAEISDGWALPTALERTMTTAGRTVSISGLTAASGLAMLLLVPVPFLRSMGAAGLIVPIMSVAATLTLQPALLFIMGQSGVVARGWPGLLASARASARWRWLAEWVVRRPVAVLAACVVALSVAAAPIASLALAPASLTDMPSNLEAARGAAFVTAHVGAGAVTPLEVIVDTGADGGALTPRAEAARAQLSDALAHTPGVFIVATDTTTLFVDPSARYQRLVVVGREGFGEEGTRHLVRRLRAIDPADLGYGSGSTMVIGGAPARGVDFLDTIGRTFPFVFVAALFVAFLLTARAFASRLLALVAVSMNLLSVGAALGVVGVVSRLLLDRDRVEAWSLVFLFALLFGLSMDYQVFVVSRMREAWLAGATPLDAVRSGLERTASVVTAAAVIFVCALGGLVFGHIAGLQDLGIGLAAGVLIDATVVRTLLLPSVLAVLGERVWRGR